MKETTADAMILAQELADKAAPLCLSDDRHAATAGAMILFDAVELVLYAALIERTPADGDIPESIGIPDLIKRVRKLGYTVRSDVLTPLSRQRVSAKHYGRLLDPLTVRRFLGDAQPIMDDLCNQATGRTLGEIGIYDLLPDGEARLCLEAAGEAMRRGAHYEALAEIRKAVFVEVEVSYCDDALLDKSGLASIAAFFAGRGDKLDDQWKRVNARQAAQPFDHVRVNHETLRLDLITWGVDPNSYKRVSVLTPRVFRAYESDVWVIEPMEELGEIAADAPLKAFRTAAHLLARKASYERDNPGVRMPALRAGRIVEKAKMLSKASPNDDDVLAVLKPGAEVAVHQITRGFDNEIWVRIEAKTSESEWDEGFVPRASVELVPGQPRTYFAEVLTNVGRSARED